MLLLYELYMYSYSDERNRQATFLRKISLHKPTHFT